MKTMSLAEFLAMQEQPQIGPGEWNGVDVMHTGYGMGPDRIVGGDITQMDPYAMQRDAAYRASAVAEMGAGFRGEDSDRIRSAGDASFMRRFDELTRIRREARAAAMAQLVNARRYCGN